MPAAGAEFRIIETQPNPRRHLATGGKCGEEIAAGVAVAFRDGKRRRHHFGRDVGQGGPIHVAHGHCGDEVGVEQRRTGERQRLATQHARLAALGQCGREGLHLAGLFAEPAGDRAGQRVEQQVLAMLAGAVGKIVIAQRCGEFRQCLCHFSCHTALPCGLCPCGDHIRTPKSVRPALACRLIGAG